MTGGGGWPVKLMRRFKYEHWACLGGVISYILVPWAVTLIGCPHAFEAYREVWRHHPDAIIKSNLFSLSWGIANILAGICIVRIGFTLTGAVLPAIGVSLGVTIPMIFRGSGVFENSPGLASTAGNVVIGGVAVMLAGVALVAFAGLGRDRILTALGQRSAGRLQNPIDYRTGLMMAALAGVLSCGVTFSFVYSQGPIVAAMKARGAGEFAANYSVWAVGLLGGAAINALYPAYLMSRQRSWNVLLQDRADLGLTLFLGVEGLLCFPLMGVGMLRLGALGASVGFGIQQAMQMTGSQLVGFAGGEWRGVKGRPRWQMYAAISCLLIAAAILAYGNSLAHHL